MNPDADKPSPPISTIFRWLRHDFYRSLILIIPCVALIIATLSSQNFMNWQTGHVLKNVLEVLHPALLGTFTGIMFIGFVARRNQIAGWMALLGSAFFMREIHFEGSDFIMTFILLGIGVTAWRQPSRFTDLWNAPMTLSLIAMCGISYGCSEVLFDRGLIKQPFEIIFSDPEWKLPYSSNIEESLETLGGFFLLLSGFVFLFRPAAQANDATIDE